MTVCVALGIAVNVLLSFLSIHFDLPLWFDTIGTIAVSMLGGVLPGITTAVGTNVLCSFFNPSSLYYTLVGVLISIATTWFVWNGRYKKKVRIVFYILTLALLGGVLGTLFQWVILGGPQFIYVAETSRLLTDSTGISYIITSIIVTTGLNIVDKGISAGLAFLAVRLVPPEIRKTIGESGWRQKPLSDDDRKRFNRMQNPGMHSLQKRMGILLSFATASITAVLSFISINLFFNNQRQAYTQNAIKAAGFAADVVDGDKVGQYLKLKEDAPGYEDVRRLLYWIRNSSSGVECLHVIKIEQDGVRYIFDLETEDTPANKPGTKAAFSDSLTEYIPGLLRGEKIPPIESDDRSGWVLSAYQPVTNTAGETVCFAVADVSMVFLSKFAGEFLIKTLLIFSGFFILILGYGLWVSRYSMVYPISSMRVLTNDFIPESDDQKTLDNKVRAIRSLDIRTGDEVEELYLSISKMASGIAEQIRMTRYYSEATAQMQNGLIITMADLVENRDSDTGAHIQKTAAYVRIILEGLKKKGYYTEKLTPKFISDAVMSAPLHDVGKINIPDKILNKPGKLTPEEYEIMKTHTIAGRKIMENAISTVQGENYLKEALNMAAYHHERWDGKGYPEGLHGEVIPLSARVMSVADVFDALASPRIYKPAFPFEKALDILREGAGSQFDPKCVEVFLESITEVKLVLKKYQDVSGGYTEK